LLTYSHNTVHVLWGAGLTWSDCGKLAGKTQEEMIRCWTARLQYVMSPTEITGHRQERSGRGY